MRDFTLKLVSVACALIMVMTVFQVLTADVAAEDLDPISYPTEHDHRRMTISNDGSRSPSSSTSPNGTLHLAWANIVSGGMELMFKSSYDNGTMFTSDKAVSPVFFSISNISISCSEGLSVGMVFEGRQTSSSNSTVYMLYSCDGGSSWGQTCQLCEGRSPSAVLRGDAIYIALSRPYGDSSVFSILNVTMAEDEVSSCTQLMTLSIGQGFGKITTDGSAIYYAIRCTSPYAGIVYGSIGYDGQQINSNTLVHSIYSSDVPSIDIDINDGRLLIAWSVNTEEGANIQGATSSDDHSAWTPLVISSSEGSFGSISMAPHGSGFFIAWENTTRSWTEISTSSISDISSFGSVITDASSISTDRVQSSSPSVTVDMSGEVSCIWAEKHRSITELFYFQNVLFESITIGSLNEYIGSLNIGAFTSPSARSYITTLVDEILYELDIGDDIGALTRVETLITKVDGFCGGNVNDDLVTSTMVKIKIFQVLSALRNDLCEGDPDRISIYDIEIDGSGSSFNISWATSKNGTSAIEYGTTPFLGNTIFGGNGTDHAITLSDLWQGATYYFRIRSADVSNSSDIAYSDERSFTTSYLSIPAGVWDPGIEYNNTVSSVSVTLINSATAVITWTSWFDSTSVVSYGSSASYGKTEIGASGTSHSVMITNLSAMMTYHYMVSSACLSNSSNIGCSADSYFTTGLAEISSVTTNVLNSSAVRVTWYTQTNSSSVVEYGPTSSYGKTVSGPGGTTNHVVILTGLLAATTYHIRVRSVSTTNSSDVEYSLDRTFTTGSAEISSVSYSVLSSSSVRITWTTASSGTSVVEYGASSSYGSIATGSSGTSHTVTITDLRPSTTYHFRAKSVISSSGRYSADLAFTTAMAEISTVTVTINGNSATLTWETDRDSTSEVRYGTTSDYGYVISDSSNDDEHSLTINGLASGTNYHFMVRSVRTSTTYCSADKTFYMPSIAASNIIVTPVGSTSIRVNWTTSIAGSSIVEYGTSSGYGNIAIGTSGTTHSVTLTGLSPSVSYHLRVKSASSSNSSDIAYSADSTFRPGMIIYSITSTTVNSITVTISWLTSNAGVSTVHYGPTSSYGNSISGGSGTSHSVTIAGLSASTLYHYMIELASATNSSDIVSSVDMTFATSSPEITSVSVTVLSSTSVKVHWTTTSSGTSVVDYGATSSYGATATGDSNSIHDVTITGLEPSTTYHFRPKSVISSTLYGADATFTTSAPEISSVSVTIGSSAITITWSTTSSGTSIVEYGLTSSYGETNTNILSTRSHSISLSLEDLSTVTTYHFRVRSVISSSATYCSSDRTFATPAITITNVAVTSESSTSVKITWTTSHKGSSLVEYGPTSAYGCTATGSSATSHSVKITGLSPATIYHFRVKTISSSTSSDYAYSGDATFTTDDPEISSVTITVQGNDVRLRWSTQLPSSSIVDYGTSASYGTTYSDSTLVGNHDITLYDVPSGATYHFRVRSSLTALVTYYSADRTFSIPAISITNVVPTVVNSISFTITWTTNIDGTTVLEYGTTTAYGSTATGPSGTSHSISIIGLAANTTYHYRIRSASVSNSSDERIGSDTTFKTNAAEISSVFVFVLSSSSVRISWVSVYGTTVVEYGKSPSYGSTATVSGNTILHTVTLTSLASATTYHFRVKTVYDQKSYYSVDLTFTTPRIELNNVIVTVMSSTSVRINWTTSMGGTSEIEYGTAASYGSMASVSGNGTSHSVTVTGLASGTTYHFRARSASATNSTDIAYSNDSTFRAGIVVSNVVFTVGSTSVTINWTTNIAGGSVVDYGRSSSYDHTASGSGTLKHSVTINGLASNVTYHFRVNSASSTNTSDIGYSNDSTFKTGIAISNIVVSVSGTTVTINWMTNIDGTAMVYYGTTTNYTNSKSGSGLRSHTVTITGLASGTTYHFKIRSAASANISDVAYSSDGNFTILPISIVPTINSVQYLYSSGPSVKIMWTTSIKGTSAVEYGTTSSYGFTYTNLSTTTQHVVWLTGLSSATTYHFRVRSASATNPSDIVTGNDITFTTSGIQIIGLKPVVRSSLSVEIQWNTDYSGSTKIEYGLNTSYGTTIIIDGNSTHHYVVLDGLRFNTQYFYRVTSVSQSNGLDVKTAIAYFTTPTVSVSGIKVDVTNYTATIGWNTNLNCTTLVEYGTDQTNLSRTATGQDTTSHSVFIGYLEPGKKYYYRFTTASVSYPADVQTRTGNFTTLSVNDAGQREDSWSTRDHALRIVTGSFSGALFAPYDQIDCFNISVSKGQMIEVVLNVPSTANLDLILQDPSGNPVSVSCNGVGVTETIRYTATSSDIWHILISWTSGSGSITYSCSVEVSNGTDIYDLNIGSVGDDDIGSHLPGLCIYNQDDLWLGQVSGSVGRDAKSNASFLLNIYELSYQKGTNYLISLGYTSMPVVTVQVYNNGQWVDVATLPGRSCYCSSSFVLDSKYLYDALPNETGMNVRLRFSTAFSIRTISAVAYSYTSDFTTSSVVRHNPGITLISNWAINGGMANGTNSPVLMVTVPFITMSYDLTFTYLNSTDGMMVQIYKNSSWSNVGSLVRWGSSATVFLNCSDFRDSDAAAGTNLLLRINGAIYNLTSVTLRPSVTSTGFNGGEGTSCSSQAAKLFGVSIDSATWDNTTVGSVSARQVRSGSAYFYLNAPLAGQSYRINVSYSTSIGGHIDYYTAAANPPTPLVPLTGGSVMRTASFSISSDSYYDGIGGSFINVKFRLTSSKANVTSFCVSVDSDGDGLTDKEEITVHHTDPFSTDSDSDGLGDKAELTNSIVSKRTDPTDPDTDDDGLLDGSETWSQSWTNDQFYNITDGVSGSVVISYTLPALSGTTAATLFIGIVHQNVNDIQIEIRKDPAEAWDKVQETNKVSGPSLFRSYNLFNLGYSKNDFTTGPHTWYIRVSDLSMNGISGQLQYATMQLSGETERRSADSDGDGILDGEEVNFGEDGWTTNPVLTDTDSDGISDYNEIHGNTLCGCKTDPTLKDTDDDGFQDNVDINSTGDVLIKVTFTKLYLSDDVNNVDSPNLFVGIRSNGMQYFTEHFEATKEEYTTLGLTYYFDIWDSNSTMQFKMTVVAYRPNTGGDDIKIDAGSDGGDDKEWWYSFNTAYSSQTVTNIGSDVSLTAKFEKVVQQKANTVVVEGVKDNQTYGLTKAGTQYRYDADSQVILLYLNCSSASEHFVNGTNVIVLPRAVALDSRLNDTLFGIGSITSDSALFDATFCYSDQSVATSSSHILAVISKNVTAAQAESILDNITHDGSNARVGNNVSISSSQLYLLHLPKDILSHIPMIAFVNSDTGNAPNYLDWGDVWESLVNTVVSVAKFVYRGLVAAYELYIHINRALIDVGIAIVGALTAYYQNVIDTVVDIAEAMVDAFNVFVDWAIEFIKSTISSLMNGMIDGLRQLGNAFCRQAQLSCDAAACDYDATGATSSEQSNKIVTAFAGTFFITLLTVGYVIIAALIILKVVTNVFSFLVGLVVSTILTFIVIELFRSTISYLQGDDPFDNLSTFLSSFITGKGGDPHDHYLSAAEDIVIGAFDILAVGIMKVSLPEGYDEFPRDMAASICGLLIAIYADNMAVGFGGLLLSVLGLELSLYGLLGSIKELIKRPGMDSNSKIAYLFVGMVSFVGVGKGSIDVWESVQGLAHGN